MKDLICPRVRMSYLCIATINAIAWLDAPEEGYDLLNCKLMGKIRAPQIRRLIRGIVEGDPNQVE